MPYYDIGTTLSPEKKSLLRRPATSYETVSPGPQYDIGTTITPKRRTIGVRHSQKDPHAEDPAPDSYWTREVSAKSPPFMGFPGSADRCPVDLSKEAKKPGPGYYETSPLFESGRGFKFTSKPDTQVRPDSAAPYQPSPSSLGGPHYTIGLKDV
jgi:hypothetical protein